MKQKLISLLPSILIVATMLFLTLPAALAQFDPVGKISPPPNVNLPNVSGNPSSFVAGIVQGLIRFLLIGAFIVALLWTIFAGFRFVTAGGDEKTIGSAWSQIYFGLLGLAIVVGAYAIVRLAELFFNVNILTGTFQLPQR